ncbi:hypothetical protein TI03_03680 [Achromatium sp. WMS1]|nr:hypothetical protein TI03_03680 [Achromatium sp. WMS1]
MSVIVELALLLLLLLFYCPILNILGVLYAIFVYAWSTLLVAKANDYGHIAITRTHIGKRLLLMHDGVIHSVQNTFDQTPEGYCYPGSGAADVLSQDSIIPDQAQIALIGLGTGAILHYARPGQQWICYEVNAAVADIAADPTLFTFLSKCPAQVTISYVDGFVAVDKLGQLDVVIVDAFFADNNLGTQAALANSICQTTSANALFLLHVSGLSDQEIDDVVRLSISYEFTSAIKETPSYDTKVNRCSLNDFRYPFQMPAKWLVLSHERNHITTLLALPDWRPCCSL